MQTASQIGRLGEHAGTRPAAADRITVLDCPVDNVTMAEAIERIDAFIRSGTPHQIVPINAAKLWRMERDPRLDRIVRDASLIIAEKAIVMGSRWLNTPLKAHVGGVTLLKELLPVAERRGYRLFFLGARPEIVEAMVRRLQRDYPGLRIVGWHHGYFSPDDDGRLVGTIREARPDLLFVAMGTPKQEYWLADHLHMLGVPACMGVGGSFDVLAGLKRDAPDWVRALAMEWLYRLLQDPRNLWKRYLTTIPWFILRCVRRKLAG